MLLKDEGLDINYVNVREEMHCTVILCHSYSQRVENVLFLAGAAGSQQFEGLSRCIE